MNVFDLAVARALAGGSSSGGGGGSSDSGSAGIPVVEKTASDTTASLDPNKFYVFPEMSALTITLATPEDDDIVNEYHFRFNSGDTATTLSLPVDVVMPDGFEVEADMTYEISIIDLLGLAVSWEYTPPAAET